MSALDTGRSSLAGLSLDDILGSDKRGAPPPPPPPNNPSRTLLDIIRDDHKDGHRDKKSWKTFRDKLRLKRAGAAWTSSVPIPASDIIIQHNNPRLSRRGSFGSNPPGSTPEIETVPISDPPAARPLFSRRASTRFGSSPPHQSESNHPDDSADSIMPGDGPPARSFGPQFSRHNSTRMPPSNADLGQPEDDEDHTARGGSRRLGTALAEERALSAREAVAAQEAAEAEAAAAVAAAEEEAAATPEMAAPVEPEPVRMSLMDLLEETDRQMGLVGSRYTMGDDDEYDEDEEEEEDDDDEDAEEEGGIEYNCCVCMVRSKGAAFIPCGHTFCRLCSRELWVQRGNCPLCNGFILEILDIF